MHSNISTPQEATVDGGITNEALRHRPGAVSYFFVYKAGLFALCFWSWLGVLAWRGGAVSGWHLVAVCGAVTTTLVAVLLGVRIALARAAAARHEQIMRTLVELSWYAFAHSPPENTAANDITTGGDADVIALSADTRPRPRR